MRQLVEYIKKNLSKGYAPETLKWSLIDQGEPRSSVERAIKTANKELAKKLPKFEEKPRIKVKKEPILQEIEKPKLSERLSDFWYNLKEIFRS